MQTTNQTWVLRFIPLWVGQALSLLGSQLVQFAIIWYLTRETNSATTLAIASMMGLLPQVLLSPFIGTWVDRGNLPSDLFWVGIAANVATGLLLPIINGSFGATLQAAIAPEMQGRVFAFILSAAMLVSPLALIIAGPFADAFGIQAWFLIAGISCTLMGLLGFFSSDVMTMENKSSENTPHAAAEPS